MAAGQRRGGARRGEAWLERSASLSRPAGAVRLRGGRAGGGGAAPAAAAGRGGAGVAGGRRARKCGSGGRSSGGSPRVAAAHVRAALGAAQRPPLRARPQRREPVAGGRASAPGYLRTWAAPVVVVVAGRMAAQPAAEACACAAAPGDDGEEVNGRKVALITGITGQVTVGAPLLPGLSPPPRRRAWRGAAGRVRLRRQAATLPSSLRPSVHPSFPPGPPGARPPGSVPSP